MAPASRRKQGVKRVATISVKTNEKFEPPPPPPSPHFNDEKKARFGLRANSSLIWGEGGFISHFILSKIAISVKTNEKFEPPSPHFNDEKKARFGLRANSSLIWGGGGFISHFILSKIVVTLST